MESVGLVGWEDRLNGSLSKGFRQRVGLAQALIHEPPVLILDEPTVGLDPAQLVGIRRLIRDLASERLIILSTHILQEVEMLCERVILIHKGQIVGDGTVDTLAEQVGAGSWLELVVSGADDTAEASLAQLERVESVRRLDSEEPGVVRLRLTGPAGMAQTLAVECAKQGWEIFALSRHGASLEEVFLALVGEER